MTPLAQNIANALHRELLSGERWTLGFALATLIALALLAQAVRRFRAHPIKIDSPQLPAVIAAALFVIGLGTTTAHFWHRQGELVAQIDAAPETAAALDRALRRDGYTLGTIEHVEPNGDVPAQLKFSISKEFPRIGGTFVIPPPFTEIRLDEAPFLRDVDPALLEYDRVNAAVARNP